MDVSTVKSDLALPYVSDQKRDTFSLCKVTNLLVRLGPISQMDMNLKCKKLKFFDFVILKIKSS